jgi:hypothetical protein
MRTYGPFDKPYGVATLSGIHERIKGAVVLIVSEALFLAWFILLTLLTESAQKDYQEIISFIVTSPVLFLSIAGHMAGVIWMFFPEWKPELRKRLTW